MSRPAGGRPLPIAASAAQEGTAFVTHRPGRSNGCSLQTASRATKNKDPLIAVARALPSSKEVIHVALSIQVPASLLRVALGCVACGTETPVDQPASGGTGRRVAAQRRRLDRRQGIRGTVAPRPVAPLAARRQGIRRHEHGWNPTGQAPEARARVEPRRAVRHRRYATGATPPAVRAPPARVGAIHLAVYSPTSRTTTDECGPSTAHVDRERLQRCRRVVRQRVVAFLYGCHKNSLVTSAAWTR